MVPRRVSRPSNSPPHNTTHQRPYPHPPTSLSSSSLLLTRPPSHRASWARGIQTRGGLGKSVSGKEVGIPLVELNITNTHAMFFNMLFPYSRFSTIGQTDLEFSSARIFAFRIAKFQDLNIPQHSCSQKYLCMFLDLF